MGKGSAYGGKGRSGQRPKKRKAPPNRHLLTSRLSKALKLKEEEEEHPPRPSGASDRKLEDKNAEVTEETEQRSGLRVIDIDKVFKEVLSELGCKNCRGETKLIEVRRCGFSSQYQLMCKNCGVLKVIKNSYSVDLDDKPRETGSNQKI